MSGEIVLRKSKDKRMFFLIDRNATEKNTDLVAVKLGFQTLLNMCDKFCVKAIAFDKTKYDGLEYQIDSIKDIFIKVFQSIQITLCVFKSEVVEIFDREKMIEILKNYYTLPLGTTPRTEKDAITNFKQIYLERHDE